MAGRLARAGAPSTRRAPAGSRVLAGHARAVLPVLLVPRAREPDRHHRALRAVARPDPRLRGHRLPGPRRVLRPRRLHGGDPLEERVGRAPHRPRARGGRGRGGRLRDELRDRPVPAPGPHHDHARPGGAAPRGGEPGPLAHRRRGRPAGGAHVAALRPPALRPLRLHGVRLLAGRPVPALPGRTAADPVAPRPGAPRHPGERDPHARDRGAEPGAHPQGLHAWRR